MTYTEKLQSLIDHYGLQEQSGQCIEECAELILALRKYWRFDPIRHDTVTHENLRRDIADELADVQIMVDQMRIGFGVGDLVDERIRYKLERQRERMGAQEGQNE